MDTALEILFVSLVVFMVNFKLKHVNRLSLENKLVLGWISFLFLTCIFQSTYYLFIGIVDYLPYNWGSFIEPENWGYIKFRDISSFIIFPLKDFLLAISFTMIYAYQGLAQKKLDRTTSNLTVSRLGLISTRSEIEYVYKLNSESNYEES